MILRRVRRRAWLTKWGIDTQAVKSGNVDVAQTLTQIGEGLNTLPAGIERAKAGMDLFRKAGIDLIPVLSELPST